MSLKKYAGSGFVALAFTAVALAQRPTEGVNTGGRGAFGDDSGLILALIAVGIFLGVGVIIGYLIGKASNK